MSDEDFVAAVKVKFPNHVKEGKVTGQIRLYCGAWDALREFVYARDGGRCVDCLKRVVLAKGHWATMHAAHIKTKGAGHDDLPSNVLCKCLECHAKEHNGSKRA